MYKVFFKDRILFLTDQIDQDLISSFDTLHKYTSQTELLQFIQTFNDNENLKVGFLYGKKLDFIFRQFCACFKCLRAAGGVVFNSDNEFLAMERLGMSDLPKGKTEANESIEETALREVEEECGISNLTIIHKITSTYHTYALKNKLVLKETVWYKMRYDGREKLIPQTEENITAVKWMPLSELDKFAKSSYASIREVLELL